MRLNKFTGLFMAAVLAVATFNFVPAKKASADNPVVQTYFTADPSPLVVGDTLYLITSHDEDVLEKNKRKKFIINTITAVMDEYFPEFRTVFKHPFKGKASMHLLKVCPIPKFILELGEKVYWKKSKKQLKRRLAEKKLCSW